MAQALFDARMKRLLCQLADPQSPPPAILDLENIDLGLLLSAARYHCVEPVVWRKLKQTRISSFGNANVLVQDIADQQFAANARAMDLEARGDGLCKKLRGAKVRAVLVKGADFAGALYPVRADRPFTDIDILVHEKDQQAAEAVLQQAGYRQMFKPLLDRSAIYREQKWADGNDRGVLVELHQNLVHDSVLRRRVSFGYREHLLVCNGTQTTANARFFIAVVHACAGHKLHKLQLLVDVLQAIRALQPREMTGISEHAKKLGVGLEAGLCCKLAYALFGEPAAAGIAGSLPEGRIARLASGIVTPNTILDAFEDWFAMSKLRRHTFRLVQKRFA